VTAALLTAVAVLLAVAIAVQVYYLRGFAKAGVEVTRATKVVSYVNIGLLSLLVAGLMALALSGRFSMLGAG